MEIDIKDLLELLRQDGSIIINKSLARNIGRDEALLFSELTSRFLYFSNRNQLDENGYFFNTIADLEEATTIKEYQQRKYFKKLKELGLIDYTVKGMPAKRYFKINTKENNISQFLKNSTISSLKIKELEPCGLRSNNTNINNTNYNNKEIGDKDIASSKLFNLLDKYRGIIEQWNSYKEFTTHNIKKNKTIKEILKLLKILTTGNIGKMLSINPEYLLKHKIPKEFLTRKFTEDEILKAIHCHAEAFSPNVFPTDKKNLPKSLGKFIYNESTGSSMFLKYMANGKPASFKIPEVEDKILKIYKKISVIPKGEVSERTLKFQISDIIKEHHRIIKKFSRQYDDTSFDTYIGTISQPYNFHEMFVEWLEEVYGDSLKLNQIKIDTMTWEKFMKFIETEHGFDLNINVIQKEIKKIILKEDDDSDDGDYGVLGKFGGYGNKSVAESILETKSKK